MRIAIYQGDINCFHTADGQARRLRRFQRSVFAKNGSQIYTPPVTSSSTGPYESSPPSQMRRRSTARPCLLRLPVRYYVAAFINLTSVIAPGDRASAASSDHPNGLRQKKTVVVHPENGAAGNYRSNQPRAAARQLASSRRIAEAGVAPATSLRPHTATRKQAVAAERFRRTFPEPAVRHLNPLRGRAIPYQRDRVKQEACQFFSRGGIAFFCVGVFGSGRRCQ